MNLTPRDVYRASDVSRWQIVKTTRRQSVAEHSYHVAMIARGLCRRMDCVYLQDRVVNYALLHDLAEVVTGDIAPPLKRVLGTERLGELESRIRVDGEAIDEAERVKYIVKMADLIEAVKFLDDHACNDHGRRIRDQLAARVDRGGAIVRAYMSDLLVGKENTLDDMS